MDVRETQHVGDTHPSGKKLAVAAFGCVRMSHAPFGVELVRSPSEGFEMEGSGLASLSLGPRCFMRRNRTGGLPCSRRGAKPRRSCLWSLRVFSPHHRPASRAGSPPCRAPDCQGTHRTGQGARAQCHMPPAPACVCVCAATPGPAPRGSRAKAP